ncbi:MAG: glycosyltransferase [Oribacterium sp.]|nr:glycosyltransferase [Oribacterium sp.]
MNKAKEILIVTISLGNDGAERVLTELAKEWIHIGCKVFVIQTDANRYGNSYAMPDSIQMINICVKSKNKVMRFLQEIKAVRKVISVHQDATVVSFLSASSFVVAMASLGLKNKIVFSERNDPRRVPIGKHQQLLRNFAFHFADRIVFQTNDAQAYFDKSIQKRGIIIPNPINGALPDRYEGERKKIIVTACRLHPQKNLKMLIDAFSMLQKDYPDYKLIIYGEGVLRQELEAYIRSLNLSEQILLPGFQNDIVKKIMDCAVYACSSNYEGISNSMLEAMAMGVPTVVTDCPVGGARMMINNEVNGMLVPVGDTKSMYIAMKRIIDDPELAERLSNNAFDIRNRLPVSKIAKQWLDIM